MMNGKEKLYFLLNRIDDIRTIAPSGLPLVVDPLNDLNDRIRKDELLQLFTKLENDEKVLKVLKEQKRIKTDLDEFDPYDHADDGCWHIRLLPTFDKYFQKTQQEFEYQEFTGKKPISKTVAIKVDSSTATYETKLNKILSKLHSERELTRKGYKTKITFNDKSFTKIRIWDTCKVLLKLQDDEGAIKILEALQPSDTVTTEQIVHPNNNDNYESVEEISVEIDEVFDKWYEDYLLKQKGRIENLDYRNLLKILDVVLDINEAIQMSNSTKINIPCLPQTVKFQILFPVDSTMNRQTYKDCRWESTQYLFQRNITSKPKYIEADFYGHGTIEMMVNLPRFQDFLSKITDEYESRNESTKDTKRIEVVDGQGIIGKKVVSKNIIWPDGFIWKGQTFVFGNYGMLDFFISEDRRALFKVLTDKKGGWATITELKGNKNDNYVRSTIKQIEDRFSEDQKEHITIISTQDDDFTEKPSVGAYRIKVTE